jgi:hypothetical protein
MKLWATVHHNGCSENKYYENKRAVVVLLLYQP